MSFGDILGQIMQQGSLGGQAPAQNRLETAAQQLGLGGQQQAGGAAAGGLGGLFQQLQGALAGATGGAGGGAAGAAGGFADKARDFLTQNQVGSLSGAQIGGIGAIAGALLGGGAGGAAKGGAMAVLGTLAVSALQKARAAQQEASASAAAALPAPSADDLNALVHPDTEQLLLKAMISAARADGQIDQQEMQAIVGRVSADTITEDEKAFLQQQLTAPLTAQSIAAEVPNPAVAAQVYAASLFVAHDNNPAEQAYLADLAKALNLDATTVAHLHEMTGAAAAA